MGSGNGQSSHQSGLSQWFIRRQTVGIAAIVLMLTVGAGGGCRRGALAPQQMEIGFVVANKPLGVDRETFRKHLEDELRQKLSEGLTHSIEVLHVDIQERGEPQSDWYAQIALRFPKEDTARANFILGELTGKYGEPCPACATQ